MCVRARRCRAILSVGTGFECETPCFLGNLLAVVQANGKRRRASTLPARLQSYLYLRRGLKTIKWTKRELKNIIN